MFNIQCIKHIWNTLTQSACQTLVQGLVMAHLNYASALYFGLPDIDVNRTKYSTQTHPWENKSGQYYRMSQRVTLTSY